MKLRAIIKAASARMVGVSVHVDQAHGWVTIKDLSGVQDDIFLQGDDASAFISEAWLGWKQAGYVTLQECYEWQAEPYTENLWN